MQRTAQSTVDVGPGLEDDADDSDRDPDLAQEEAVRPRRLLQDLAEGVGERGHLADGFGEVAQAGGGEGEPVDLRGRQAVFPGRREIPQIGPEDRAMGALDPARQVQEGRVARTRGRDRERQRCRARAHGDGGDECLQVLGHGSRALSPLAAPSAKKMLGLPPQSKILPRLNRQRETPMTSEVMRRSHPSVGMSWASVSWDQSTWLNPSIDQ